ncbi:hypothetical protein V8G54_013064 [Vigna mungo]|uniref:Uncharacterized protein n=1 Tax=Vigna mungo TaxID=3915 RepID=A0AAQ3S3Y9_VIGMU
MEKKQWWGEKVLLRFEHSRCAENIRMYIIFLSKDKWDNSLRKSCLYFFDNQKQTNKTCQLHFQIFLVQYQTSYEFSLLVLQHLQFLHYSSQTHFSLLLTSFIWGFITFCYKTSFLYETLLDFS